jgi:hypothetical protein
MSFRGFVLALLALFAPACSSCTNGHVDPKPFVVRPGDDVVHCVCNLTFEESVCNGTCRAHFDIDLCLPTWLQRDGGVVPVEDLGPPPPLDGGDDYSRAINDYCAQAVSRDVYDLVKVFSGGWCGYKAPHALDGGIGHSVECFAQQRTESSAAATARDDGTCARPCTAIACSYDNCGAGVEDDFGNVNLDNCKCSQVTTYRCPHDPDDIVPTEVFCRPPAGSVK